jgi:hypothetical protein
MSSQHKQRETEVHLWRFSISDFIGNPVQECDAYEIEKIMEPHAKMYAFQLEKDCGQEDLVFRGIIYLRKKGRINRVRKILDCEWSRCADPKEAVRQRTNAPEVIAGPWGNMKYIPDTRYAMRDMMLNTRAKKLFNKFDFKKTDVQTPVSPSVSNLTPQEIESDTSIPDVQPECSDDNNNSRVFRWKFVCTMVQGKSARSSRAYIIDRVLQRYAKKYVFQFEKHPRTNESYFRGYVSLKDKMRHSDVAKLFPAEWTSHVRKEMLSTFGDKADHFVDGPWGNVHEVMCTAIPSPDERIRRDMANSVRATLSHEDLIMHHRMKTSLMSAEPGEHITVYVDKEGNKKCHKFAQLAQHGDPEYLNSWCMITLRTIQQSSAAFQKQLTQLVRIQAAPVKKYAVMRHAWAIVVTIPTCLSNNSEEWNKLIPVLENALEGAFFNEESIFYVNPPPRVLVACNSIPEPCLQSMGASQWNIIDVSDSTDAHLIPYHCDDL